MWPRTTRRKPPTDHPPEANGDLSSTVRRVRLVLASTSPRRKLLLARAGLRFNVVPPPPDMVPPPGICSELAVQLIARHKAMSVAASQPPGTFVIGADTMVIGPSGPMGKPLTAEKARWMLGELRGRRHTVITGISAIAAPDAKETLGFSRSALKMRDFSDAILETYVATGEPLDKAGGYAIQGGGSDLVEAVQGRIDNVIGLDIALALKLLAEAGYPDPLPTVSDVPLSSLRGERRPPSPTRVKQTV